MVVVLTPKHDIIERTAGELAAVYYEAGRSSGMTSKWPNARAYAKANIEHFIPKATELLLSMLSPTSNINDSQREVIYEALMERNDDPALKRIFPTNKFPDYLKVKKNG